MSTQPPLPPSDPHFYGPQQPPPPHYPQRVHTTTGTDGSKRWLNMSGGILMAVIAAVILCCCIGPVAAYFLSDALDEVLPKPKVTVTSCKVDDDGIFTGATIGYRITNTRAATADYTVHFVVKDAAGTQVGAGTDEVTALAAGATANKTADVDLDARGGKTCEVVDVT